MNEQTSEAMKATSETPSQPSQTRNLGRLGNLFETLTRREKNLISDTGKINNPPIRNRVGESLPSLPRYLDDPPPPYFDRIIVGHGLPVEYRESPDGECYLKNGLYHFRRLNPAHPANRESISK